MNFSSGILIDWFTFYDPEADPLLWVANLEFFLDFGLEIEEIVFEIGLLTIFDYNWSYNYSN